MTRWEWLQELERVAVRPEGKEEKLPLWVQIKINRLRFLLEAEARENDLLREEVERLL